MCHVLPAPPRVTRPTPVTTARRAGGLAPVPSTGGACNTLSGAFRFLFVGDAALALGGVFPFTAAAAAALLAAAGFAFALVGVFAFAFAAAVPATLRTKTRSFPLDCRSSKRHSPSFPVNPLRPSGDTAV
jgi:hypothetical protein